MLITGEKVKVIIISIHTTFGCKNEEEWEFGRNFTVDALGHNGEVLSRDPNYSVAKGDPPQSNVLACPLTKMYSFAWSNTRNKMLPWWVVVG